MKHLIPILLILLLNLQADIQLAPDGTYVGTGNVQLTPNNTYIAVPPPTVEPEHHYTNSYQENYNKVYPQGN